MYPLSLLYKEHKEWSYEDGGIPLTRPVAGGHLGMNMHISEIISDIVEPLADTFKGGCEVISLEDLIKLGDERVVQKCVVGGKIVEKLYCLGTM